MTVTEVHESTATARPVRPAALLSSCILAALVLMAAVLWIGGGRPVPSPTGLPDAGPLTAWGLMTARTVSNLAAVLTVGLLLLGAVLVPARQGQLRGARLRWTRAARFTAPVWALAVVMQIVFTVSDVLAQPVSGILEPAILRSFVTDIDLGRALFVQVLLIVLVGVLAYAVTSTAGSAIVGLLALLAMTPPALTGHSAASENHMAAVSSLIVHVVSVGLWCGGVAALVLLGTSERTSFAVALPRFSTMALWCAIAVGASGVVNSAVRMQSPSDLVTSSYGRIVLFKLLLITVIGLFGWWYRKHILGSRSDATTTWRFVRVAAVEVVIMAATIGVGTALSRTPPPVSRNLTPEQVTPARLVLGFDLPPAPDVGNLLWGQARLDAAWFTIGALMIGLYMVGLRQLRRSGDGWPVGRTVGWFSGTGLLLVVTNSGLATYGHILFSVHMVQHMVLSMVIPIFLVLGAPITLALRTLPRPPDQVGPREWLLRILHSRFVAVVSNPIVAAAVFVLSFYVLYVTPLFEYLMRNMFGHFIMSAHFLLAGSLFFWSLIGVDPGPRRPAYLVRVAILLLVIPAHAFFALTLLTSTTVVAAEYYTSLARPYATNLLADQRLGAAIGWATGEIPVAFVLLVLFIQWVRSDARDARRLDRTLDRAAAGQSQTDPLGEYNTYLRTLADRDATSHALPDEVRHTDTTDS